MALRNSYEYDHVKSASISRDPRDPESKNRPNSYASFSANPPYVSEQGKAFEGVVFVSVHNGASNDIRLDPQDAYDWAMNLAAGAIKAGANPHAKAPAPSLSLLQRVRAVFA